MTSETKHQYGKTGEFSIGERVQVVDAPRGRKALDEGVIVEAAYNGHSWVYRLDGRMLMRLGSCLRRCDGTTFEELMQGLKEPQADRFSVRPMTGSTLSPDEMRRVAEAWWRAKRRLGQ